MSDPLPRRRLLRLRLRSSTATRPSPTSASTRRTQTGDAAQSGGNMEGKEVRFGIADSADLGRRDDGRLQRLRQLHARQLHAARRPRAAVQHAPRRGRLRRHRLRPLRHAGLRHHRRLRRRPDDRPHARVPRQEDRPVRDEAAGIYFLITSAAILLLTAVGTTPRRRDRPAR